jgi:hypothetical protein
MVVSTLPVPAFYYFGPCGSQITVTCQFVLYIGGADPLAVETTIILPTATAPTSAFISFQFLATSAEFTVSGETFSLVKT